jgi:hypothetical protein
MTPQEQISVTLTAAEWNAVMQKLGTHPFVEVVQLINSIQTQCMQHEFDNTVSKDSSRVSGQN